MKKNNKILKNIDINEIYNMVPYFSLKSHQNLHNNDLISTPDFSKEEIISLLKKTILPLLEHACIFFK
jgi:hypothetical protein